MKGNLETLEVGKGENRWISPGSPGENAPGYVSHHLDGSAGGKDKKKLRNNR